jgi:crotonobetainyl-CoA:carnitine CoA-transferase CaiB-like acyl-CoA transferase
MALPLSGLRILDLSNVFSLPYATALLCDLGAEVIKIEGPGRIDLARQGLFSAAYPDNQPGPDPWNRTSTFNLLNRGKKSLVLDLARPAGRAVLQDLIRKSDILAENFTPRVMRGWGLDYPRVRQLQPDIIMLSCSGFGREGPYEQYPAQATTQEATHGLVDATGYIGGLPSKAGQSFVDFLASWTVVIGALLALRYRRRSGKGMWVDVGMYQLGCTILGERILDFVANERQGGRHGNRHPWLAPQGCYRCAGDDQWCAISVRDDDDWAALCQLIGRPELARDSRFAGNDGRRAHHDELDAIIGGWTATLTKYAVMERVQGAGVPAGAVFDARDLNLDPHLRARGFLETVSYPPERGIGTRQIIGRPWRLDKTPLAARGPAPALGEHNREVLEGILGYGEAQCAALEAGGIVATAPTRMRPPVHLPLDEQVRLGRLSSWDADYQDRIAGGG